ncbi:hypothetical protein D3C78_1307640 [compost metagenome]
MNGPHAVDCHDASSSVVIDYLNAFRARRSPLEADSPLIVDSDAVLPRPVPCQLLQPIAGWGPQISKLSGRIEHRQLAGGDIQNVSPAPRIARFEQSLGFLTSKAQNHALILNVKR